MYTNKNVHCITPWYTSNGMVGENVYKQECITPWYASNWMVGENDSYLQHIVQCTSHWQCLRKSFVVTNIELGGELGNEKWSSV